MLISKVASPDASPVLAGTEKTHPAAARRMPSPPFRLLVVADLCPPLAAREASAVSRPLRVDKSMFPDVLAALAPRIEIDVRDRIGNRPAPLRVTLAFPNMKAFGPAEIVAQVPALSELAALRTLVSDLASGDVTAEAFEHALRSMSGEAQRLAGTLKPAAAPARTPPRSSTHREVPGGESLDRLLGMVDLDAAPPAPEAPGLVDLVARGGVDAPPPPVDRAAAKALLDDLQRILAAQVNEILHHPEFQALESRWRGLQFLVDRLDFRSPVRLDVLPAPKGALVDALRQNVLDADDAADGTPPVSLIVVDAYFDRSLADLETLADLADLAGALPAPVVAGALPALLGADSAAGIARLPVLLQHFQGSAFVHWNALRADPASAAVALALPRFLLRYPYGPDRPVKGFPFEESVGESAEAYLWGNAALAVAAAVARACVQTGLPVRFVFPEPSAEIEDLPVASAYPSPLEATYDAARQQELIDAGFTVLGARAGTDAVFVAGAPTIRRPVSYDDADATAEARMHATLPCQLLVAQAAHLLLAVRDEADAGGRGADAAAADLRARLTSWLAAGGAAPAPEAVNVEAIPAADGASGGTLALRLRTPPAVLGQPLSMVMHVPLAH